MIKITLFNTIYISIFDRCILNLRFDTSRIPFSFDLKLGLFYKVLPWFNSYIKIDEKHNKCNKIIDIICPLLFDFNLYIEQNK